MKRVAILLALALAACGEKEPEPVVKKTPPPAPKAPEIKSDPAGKNTCVACGIKTNDSACPKCKTVLKAPATTASPAAAPKPAGEAGKSAISAVYACPEDKCTFTDARKGTCLKHATVQLKEQWFVCEKCAKKEPVAGKCAGCGAELARKLQ
jgi:hypothetical protein